jgi:hypothetical protein
MASLFYSSGSLADVLIPRVTAATASAAVAHHQEKHHADDGERYQQTPVHKNLVCS